MTIHPDSFVLGILVGAVIALAVDRYVLVPVAVWLERMERRWHGRFRTR